MSILIQSMFCFIALPLVFAMPKQDNGNGYSCKYSCGNYVKLIEENVTMLTVERHIVKGTFSFVEENVVAYIMSREKYWQTITHNFGPKAESIGRKFLHPQVDEAKQWVENGKCKIGRVCAPNSDCWGSGANYCNSDDTTDWVKEKSFNYLNMWWTTAFRDTCTMDWECKIIKKLMPIHYNSEGETFVVIDDDKVEISLGAKDQLIKRSIYNVFIPTIPKENSMTIHMSCFKHKDDLLCEGANEEMIKFESGTRCTVLGANKYCLNEGVFNKIRDFGANKYASISDLNQVRDAFVANQERDNYNNFVLSLKLRKIQKIMLDMISALASKNPQILDGVLNGKFFSRYLSDGVYEVCACDRGDSCEVREFHSKGVNFCGSKVNSNKINLFDVNKTIDYVVDDFFKFQGKPSHIMDSIMEEEERGSEFENHYSNSGFWQGLTNFMNPFSWFSSSVSYIALIVSILAFMRR